MNKRYYQNDTTIISRLADQAHTKSLAIYEQRTKTERADQVIFYDIFNYEFAELIVKECSRYIEDKFDFCGDEIIIAEAVLKHFGVE